MVRKMERNQQRRRKMNELGQKLRKDAAFQVKCRQYLRGKSDPLDYMVIIT